MKRIFLGLLVLSFSLLLGGNVGWCANADEVARAIVSHRVLGSCGGSDVNMRSGPGRESDVITMLDKDQAVYGIASENCGDDYPWLQVITAKGETGWIYGQYFVPVDAALSVANLWKANFASRIFFNHEAIKNITGAPGVVEPVDANNRGNLTSDGSVIMNYGSISVGLTAPGNGSEFTSAWSTTLGYDFGGLCIGDSITLPSAREYGQMLKLSGTGSVINPAGVGWEGPDAIAEGENWWYIKALVDGRARPVRGLCVTARDSFVSKVWWGIYFV